MVANDGPIGRAITQALKDTPLLPRDGAAVQLVKRYAALIDATTDTPDILADIGPKLLRALESLGMTPAGRGVKKEGQGGPTVASKLDELRARRAQRTRTS